MQDVQETAWNRPKRIKLLNTTKIDGSSGNRNKKGFGAMMKCLVHRGKNSCKQYTQKD